MEPLHTPKIQKESEPAPSETEQLRHAPEENLALPKEVLKSITIDAQTSNRLSALGSESEKNDFELLRQREEEISSQQLRQIYGDSDLSEITQNNTEFEAEVIPKEYALSKVIREKCSSIQCHSYIRISYIYIHIPLLSFTFIPC